MTDKKPPKNRKLHGASAQQFRIEKRVVRRKGPAPKKALPSWRDIKDEFK